MRALRWITALALAWWLATAMAFAQEAEDDKSWLTRTIQDALSGAGRSVTLSGFEGALSSEASFDRLAVADDDGVWLVLEGAVLRWNRSALLRGRLEVETLSAERLELARMPISEEEVKPEAEPFSFALPDLPVSIEIAEFRVAQIDLGAPILGEPAQLRLTAQARYTDDLGFVDLLAERTDGQRGSFDIEANYQRDENTLALQIALDEAEDGIAARLLDLPGRPSVALTIAGDGPLTDFTTDVEIATDGQERLAGAIILAAEGDDDAQDWRVTADIGGDITALLAPRYRDFFGEDVRLNVNALRETNGAVDVSTFALTAQAVQLQGEVRLNAEQWPTFIDVTGTMANPDGTPLLLPGGGEDTTVEAVTLRVDYDADDGEAFDAEFDLSSLVTTGVEIARARLGLDGTLQGNLGSVGQFLGDVRLEADGVALADPALAEAVGDTLRARAELNYIEGQPVRIEDMDLSGTDYGLTGRVIVNGLEQALLTRLNVVLEADDLSRFSALAGSEIDGQAGLSLEGTVTPLSGAFDLAIAGNTEDLRFGIEQADALLAGRTALQVYALRDENGTFLRDLALRNEAIDLTGRAELRTDNSDVEARFRLADLGLVVPQYDGPVTVTASARQGPRGWTVEAETMGPYEATLTAQGLATGPDASLDFTADIADVQPFAEPFGQDITGPLKGAGSLRRDGEAWLIETGFTGPYDVSANLDGQVAPALDFSFDVVVPQIGQLVPQLDGRVAAEGQLRQTDQGFFIDTTASGPYGASAMVEGLATGPDMSLTFDVAVPNVAPLVPGVNGALDATGVVRQTPEGIAIDANATGPYASRGSVQGVVTGPNAAVDFNFAIANIAALVERVSGPLEATGSARKAGEDWRIDTDLTGPSGTQARIAGLVAADGALDLDIAGQAPLGLSRPFIAPRNLQGIARFDLSVNGPPALSSVSGTIQTADARLTLPNQRLALQGITGQIDLGGNRATIDISAAGSDGGRLRVGGAVTLTPSLPADLSVAVESLVLIDPRLYRTSLSGGLRIAGPLTGGAVIAGQINVGETLISVPSTGLTTIGDIPPITHVGAGPAVRNTRQKAGLAGAGAGDDPAAGGGGPGFGLDLQINAPNRIFVRGRGLDAELGGGLALSGSTNNVISAGRFDLIRGRLDILGKRFDLVEGSIQFQGTLVPFIRFVSATDTDQGEVRVVVQGPADDPTVTFESTPEAPQDEVLSQLLFGRNISEISAFQALQLASAVATLAGRGGSGIIGNLRDGFGLDDLDVTTTDSGATALRVGKYLTDNIYTDVTAASDGEAEVSLNLDITPNLTARGSLGSDGNSSIGIFFERDY